MSIGSGEFLIEVSPDKIQANLRQPRRRFIQESLEELAASIREVGLLQPLVVRPNGEGSYELIAGERRLRASKLAGLSKVPVVVREAGDLASLEMAIIENVQREDISPAESARAYKRFMEEFGLTQEEVADKVGKSRVSVANTLRLLRLPTRVLKALEDGLISEAHGRALLGLPDEPSQLAVFDQILEDDLTVKQVERIAMSSRKSKRGKKATMDANWLALSEQLSEYLGTPARVEKARDHAGRLVIDFYSEEDLARLMETLGLI